MKNFIYVNPTLYFESIMEFLLNLPLKFQVQSSKYPHTKYIETFRQIKIGRKYRKVSENEGRFTFVITTGSYANLCGFMK